MEPLYNEEILRGDIYNADLGYNTGSEQNGLRPVLVIQNNTGNKFSPTIIVSPITSEIKKPEMPTHVVLGRRFGLSLNSMVLLEQIRVIARERLGRFIGRVDSDTISRINQGICASLGLNESELDSYSQLVPLWKKSILSIDEAALYSGIGINRLYELTSKEDCPFVIWIGRRRGVKRKQLDEFIRGAYSI